MGPHDHPSTPGLLIQGAGVLSPELLSAIEREAKAARRSPERMVREWLEDAADCREAVAVMKRIEAGKEKLIPAEEVYKRLGLI